jgi:hypothetical protein
VASASARRHRDFVWPALPGTGIERGRIPPSMMLLSTAALIGLIIGCLVVPTWYRGAMGRRQAQQVATIPAQAGAHQRAYA